MSFTRFSSGGASSFSRFLNDENDDPYSMDNIQKKIQNNKLRIEDAGYAPEDGNRRNWFEEATNLPAGQNAFFDALELLGRGGNAVKNVIDKSIMSDRENVGQAVYRGLSGQEKVSGADLAKKAGIDNKVGQFAAGLGADILLDPVTYIPGGAIAKGFTTAAKPVAGAAKALYETAEAASPAIRNLRETRIQPALESAKDSLGYIFNPDYKKTETLFGEQSDFLKNLENQTENSRKYMQEESARSIADLAKSTGGIDTGTDVGRLLEAPLKQFDDSGQLLPRQERTLSSDPKIQDAAKNLMDSNNNLRQFAEENGISIPELEGYMTHVLSQEERAARKVNRPMKIDQGAYGVGQPNKKILNQRKLMGSAEDVNEELGRKFFEPNAYFATGIGQKRLIDYIHSVKFRREVLSNPDFATKYEKGMVIPKNAEVINTNNYKFLKDEGDSLEGLPLADEVGGKYVVTKPAKQLLDRYQKLNTDEGTKAFLKAFDNVQSLWKRFALFSPGYHVRNLAGAMFNNSIGGMSVADLSKYTPQAYKEVLNSVKGAESPLFNEYRRQGLGSSGLSQVEFARSGQEPEDAIRKTVEGLSKTTKEKVLDKSKPWNWFKTSQELGDFMDQTNRFALYKWSREKGMSPEQAAQKVREVQFDYSRLTPVEQSTIARVLPFYRWMKNNIPFQIRSFINDPRKYANVNKIRTEAQQATGLNDENMPDYMKEQFNIPVYGQNGQGKSLGLNLPLTDLMKLTDPLKLITDAVTPGIKTPIELASNYNLFRGKPIEKFEGQEKQLQIPGTDATIGIPMKTAYLLEQLTGQVGRGLSDYLQKPEDKDKDTQFRAPSLGINSILKPFDAAEAQRLQQLQELKKLQDLILYIQQQQGEKPRTVNEINRK